MVFAQRDFPAHAIQCEREIHSPQQNAASSEEKALPDKKLPSPPDTDLSDTHSWEEKRKNDFSFNESSSNNESESSFEMPIDMSIFNFF